MKTYVKEMEYHKKNLLIISKKITENIHLILLKMNISGIFN